MVRLPRELVDQLAAHALRVYPEECCGILIGSREGDSIRIERIIEADNIAEGDRRTAYQADWQNLFTAFREIRGRSEEVVGFYHSHPDGLGVPSARDSAEAWANFLYLIVTVTDRSDPAITTWAKPSDRACLAERPVRIQRET